MNGKDSKKASKRKSVKAKRSPALLPVPEKLALLVNMANLLPKFLRCSPISSNGEPGEELSKHQLFVVKDYWSSQNDEDLVGGMYRLWQLVDSLPLELQAFVWHDTHGSFIETSYGTSILDDPLHLQPFENIALFGQTEGELNALVERAKERIDVETKRTQAYDRARLGREISSTIQWGIDYQVGNQKFHETGLTELANRARQRLFFILAVEEILDALAGPDTQEKLNDTRYVERSGAIRGRLFVKNDEVQLYPPILYSFVIGIQVSRVRKCEICENYFWAGRSDMQVCSTQCRDVRRKRRQRGWYEKEGKWRRYERDR